MKAQAHPALTRLRPGRSRHADADMRSLSQRTCAADADADMAEEPAAIDESEVYRAAHAAVAAEVCYVQDVEKCRPCPPGRCCSALHNAVVACWELAPAEHSPDSSQVYSVSREAAHSSDDV